QELPFIPSLRVSGEVEQLSGTLSDPRTQPTQITIRLQDHAEVLMWDRLNIPSGALTPSATAIAQRIVKEIDPGVAAAYIGSYEPNFKAEVRQLVRRVQANPLKYRTGIIAAATAMVRLSLDDDAEELFKKAIELGPNDPEPYRAYANFLSSKGKYPE